MIEFFNLIFDNDLQSWFYIIAILYMTGKVGIYCWKNWFMHKKNKKDDDK